MKTDIIVYILIICTILIGYFISKYLSEKSLNYDHDLEMLNDVIHKFNILIDNKKSGIVDTEYFIYKILEYNKIYLDNLVLTNLGKMTFSEISLKYLISGLEGISSKEIHDKTKETLEKYPSLILSHESYKILLKSSKKLFNKK